LCSADLLYAQCAPRPKSGRLSPQRGGGRLSHGRVIAGRQPCIILLATLRRTPPMNARPVQNRDRRFIPSSSPRWRPHA
jgi:hypothetical protein